MCNYDRTVKTECDQGTQGKIKPVQNVVSSPRKIGDFTDKIRCGRCENLIKEILSESVDRIISSTDANIILDPFMGSGTTAVVAEGLGRHYIGIEISESYCKLAEERLARNRVESEVAKFHVPTLFEE